MFFFYKIAFFWINGIVVANTAMYDDAANLFRTKFTVKMDYDFTKSFEMLESWYSSVRNKLQSDQIHEIFEQMEVCIDSIFFPFK